MVTCNTFCDPGLSQSLRSDARADVGVIFADSSFIGGGDSNCILPTIAAPSCHNIIGVGLNNLICAGACNSSILNGKNYCVSGNYASIFGGQNNTVTSNCSAIFVGTGINDGGLNYVGIFGESVTGVISNAFHAENLVAQNMPLYSGGHLHFPAGSKALYYQIIGGSCYVMIA